MRQRPREHGDHAPREAGFVLRADLRAHSRDEGRRCADPISAGALRQSARGLPEDLDPRRGAREDLLLRDAERPRNSFPGRGDAPLPDVRRTVPEPARPQSAFGALPREGPRGDVPLSVDADAGTALRSELRPGRGGRAPDTGRGTAACGVRLVMVVW